MNKKEISEIRKQLKIENCSIASISLCYVNSEKEVTNPQASLWARAGFQPACPPVVDVRS